MAKTLYTGSVEVTAQNGSSGLMAYKFDAEIIENSTSTSQNKSNITCNMYATGQHGWYYEGHTGPEAFINVEGERKATVSVPNIYLSRQLICSWTGDVTHNSDGTKNIRVTFNYASNISVSYMPNNAKITADPVTLTPIPRYADINSFTVSKRDETSLKLDFTANATCDYAWYRYKLSTAGSYGSWTGVDIADAKNGSFNITGLSANSTYDVQLRVRRKDSQLTTDSSVVQQTTYNYPYVSAIGSNPLTIGNQQTLTLYNPLGRSVTVKMYKDNTSGTQLYSGTTSGTTIQFTPNTTTLYNSIPNNQEGNCVYSVIYGNSTKTTAVNKYKIKGDEYPTFSANDWNYVADKIGLTNNNKTVINKYSNVTVNVNNPATSNYGSSISKYVISWGNAPSQEISQGTGTISGGDTNTITVTAYDTRGLPKATSKTFEEFVEYTDLNINEISADRENGIEAGVKLSFRGQMYNGKFGTNGVNNALSSAKYYVSTNGTTWSGPYPNDNSMLNAIVKNDNIISLSDFTIHANGSSGGFAVGQQYYVKIEIKDGQNLLSSTQSISIVADGKIARAVYQDSNGDYHEGINGLPDSRYNQNIHGSFNADSIYRNHTLLGDASTRGVKTASAKTNTGYGTNNNYLADIAFLSYWNGAYNGQGASNLKYCEGGQIAYYPLNSIIETYYSTNPQTYFGGTWQRFGTGRVTVDVDTSDTNFNSVGKEYGEKTHILTKDELPAFNRWNGGTDDGDYNRQVDSAVNKGSYYGFHLVTLGRNYGHNNIQPSITVYRWRKTAN